MEVIFLIFILFFAMRIRKKRKSKCEEEGRYVKNRLLCFLERAARHDVSHMQLWAVGALGLLALCWIASLACQSVKPYLAVRHPIHSQVAIEVP